MLALGRKWGEAIVIFTSDGPIRIVVSRSDLHGVRLGIEAPRHIAVLREECVPPDAVLAPVEPVALVPPPGRIARFVTTIRSLCRCRHDP